MTEKLRPNFARSTLALLTGTLALLLAVPVMAHSEHRRHERPHRHSGHRHAAPRHHAVERFVVPSTIRGDSLRVYRPYYGGAVYYRPHRHRHAVYHFPVRLNGVWTPRPHVYCKGKRSFHLRF